MAIWGGGKPVVGKQTQCNGAPVITRRVNSVEGYTHSNGKVVS